MEKEFLRSLNIHMKEVSDRVKDMASERSLGALAIIMKVSF